MLRLTFLTVTLSLIFSNAQPQSTDCQNHRGLGMRYYHDQKYTEALPHFLEYAVCNPVGSSYYDASCVASLSGDTTLSIKLLKTAITNGFADYEHMESDDDLSNLRRTTYWPEVKSLLDSIILVYKQEIAKLQHSCPGANLIPFQDNNLWGYLDKNTKNIVLEPIFKNLSFLGKTGKAHANGLEFLFTCNGVIKSIESGFPSISASAWYEHGYKRTESLLKGFSTSTMEYSSIYNHSFQPVKLLDEQLAIVGKGGYFQLIDSTGAIRGKISKYKKLMAYNFGRDSEYFPDNDENGDFFIFFIDKKGKVGYFDLNLKKFKLGKKGDFQKPVGNGFDREYLNETRRFIYLSIDAKWGLWDCEKRKWQIEPQYDTIIKTDRTFDGKIEDNYYSGNTIDQYFLAQEDGQRFYIDLNNTQYRKP